MDCSTCRDVLSAQMDDHPLDASEAAAAAAHRDGCARCATWEETAAAIVRRLRLSAIEPIPDRTSSILEAAERRDLLPYPRHIARTMRATQIGIAVIGVGHVLMAIAAFQVTSEHHIHLAREHASFELALAVGLFSVALRPALAGGLLPLTAVLAASLLLTGGLDLVQGNTLLPAESLHLMSAGCVALLWWLRQRTDVVTAPSAAYLGL